MKTKTKLEETQSQQLRQEFKMKVNQGIKPKLTLFQNLKIKWYKITGGDSGFDKAADLAFAREGKI
ncbi:hypothetical protein [Pedobacter alpinus]|uniref:Uncharacterized protein n=1 Tax=Pedobacter alpinus TaxID=1590643 RepID=A0ABW5TS68_9SPHI